MFKNHIINQSFENKLNKKAFTLTEIIIATFISTIILGFLFVFLTDISKSITDAETEVHTMSSFYDFNYKLNNYRNVYSSGSIIVNHSTTNSSVLLMKDISGKNGILLGVVNLVDKKLDNDISIYGEKTVGFRQLSSSELLAIDSDINEIYNYEFLDDKIYPNLNIQDFELKAYNNGKIYDLILNVNLYFNKSLIGESWSDLPKENLKTFNINF